VGSELLSLSPSSMLLVSHVVANFRRRRGLGLLGRRAIVPPRTDTIRHGLTALALSYVHRRKADFPRWFQSAAWLAQTSGNMLLLRRNRCRRLDTRDGFLSRLRKFAVIGISSSCLQWNNKALNRKKLTNQSVKRISDYD